MTRLILCFSCWHKAEQKCSSVTAKFCHAPQVTFEILAKMNGQVFKLVPKEADTPQLKRARLNLGGLKSRGDALEAQRRKEEIGARSAGEWSGVYEGP